MNILAFDTASKLGSVTLSVGEQRYSSDTVEKHQQAETILSLFEQVLSQANKSLADIDVMVLSNG